jgi:hypothetical protein
MTIFAFVVAAVAMVATPAAAQNPTPPEFCSLGNWTVDVDFYGYVDCTVPNDPQNASQLVADPDGLCTGVQYSVTGNKPIAQAAVLAYNPAFLYDGAYAKAIAGPSNSNVVNDPCVGDSSTNSGIGSCHENAIRYNPEDVADGPFWFVVDGRREFSATTLTLKSNKLDRCEILGVGDLVDEEDEALGPCVASCGNFDPNQTIVKEEVLDIKGCRAKFVFNTLNGQLIDFINLDGTCDSVEYDITQFDFLVDGESIGEGLFGEGLFSAGSGTCSCRVIGGRVYCWGKPCPDPK